MAKKTKTLTELIRQREKKSQQLDVLNGRIIKMVRDTKTEPLYKLPSNAPSFGNRYTYLEMSLVNEDFFCLEARYDSHRIEINARPKDFQRFIVACIEAHKEYLKIKGKERRVSRLENKCHKISGRIKKIKEE